MEPSRLQFLWDASRLGNERQTVSADYRRSPRNLFTSSNTHFVTPLALGNSNLALAFLILHSLEVVPYTLRHILTDISPTLQRDPRP